MLTDISEAKSAACVWNQPDWRTCVCASHVSSSAAKPHVETSCPGFVTFLLVYVPVAI